MNYRLLIFEALMMCAMVTRSQPLLTNDFSDESQQLTITDRGECRISQGVLKTTSSYASFGNPTMKDYSFSFRARNPKDAEQVQIWAGFRAANRFDRYVVGIKGGLIDEIYLLRLGYMGTDEFLGTRPLRFHPQPGVWYRMKVETVGNRIRVFLNDENVPRIDVVDKNNGQTAQGKVTLGGGWIPTEYDDLEINQMISSSLDGITRQEFVRQMTPAEKENKRRIERSEYMPVKVTSLHAGRSVISLDGRWLFKPQYDSFGDAGDMLCETDDESWHVMTVPNFWNPIRIWLHGETMPAANGQEHKGISDVYYRQETDRCENYTFDYQRTKAAWYRQWIELPDDVKGKNMTLTFDAVSKVSEIYVNGTKVGAHVGMFGEIAIDVSRYLHPGKNLVAVKVIRDFVGDIAEADKVVGVAVTVPVTNKMLKDIAHGFYGGDPAGIWQPVKLTITDPVKVEDVFIRPGLAGVTFDLEVANHSDSKSTVQISTDIIEKKTGKVLYHGISFKEIKLNEGERKTLTYAVNDLKPLLWSPEHPNLYDFRFTLSNRKHSDALTVTSGFRTFEVKDGLFYLNGHKYWLRGGNQTPSQIKPYDRKLADTFFRLMREGNMDVTRTHTAPFNQLWMDAADENGIAVSYEGTWPWLMLESSPIPDQKLIQLWKDEFLSLIKKYRNHPSLIIWTINNEMKFYNGDNDLKRAKLKFCIISDVVKEMRKIDPTRPIVFDSNYARKGLDKKFGKEFMTSVDDGDIDDPHGYYNWYDYSLFRFFQGEFQDRYKLPGRPLISQEMSTGYPNNETGHPTRSYQIIHQNPMSLIGYKCYDFCNPAYFLNVQSFITGELAEALRRSNPDASGILHFSLLSWFRQAYDADHIKPWPTYYALKRALQPVLVSAEIWGRHLYAGEKLPARICIVNDKEDGTVLQPSLLTWTIVDRDGRELTRGTETIPAIRHYVHHWIEPAILLPASLPEDKTDVRLLLSLSENGRVVSKNQYDLLLVNRRSLVGLCKSQKIQLLDNELTSQVFDELGIQYRKAATIAQLVKGRPSVAVISDNRSLSEGDLKLLKTFVKRGGKMLLLNANEVAKQLFPDYIRGWIEPTEGDITYMEREDEAVFDGIEPLELRYFNNNKREIPKACNTALQINRNGQVTELGGQMKIHAYIDGGKPELRIKRIDSMRGFTLVRVKDGAGSALISTMCTEKAGTDPVAARLLINLLNG